jgi:hypothetical protein
VGFVVRALQTTCNPTAMMARRSCPTPLSPRPLCRYAHPPADTNARESVCPQPASRRDGCCCTGSRGECDARTSSMWPALGKPASHSPSIERAVAIRCGHPLSACNLPEPLHDACNMTRASLLTRVHALTNYDRPTQVGSTPSEVTAWFDDRRTNLPPNAAAQLAKIQTGHNVNGSHENGASAASAAWGSASSGWSTGALRQLITDTLAGLDAPRFVTRADLWDMCKKGDEFNNKQVRPCVARARVRLCACYGHIRVCFRRREC